jgi:hypothetical protein
MRATYLGNSFESMFVAKNPDSSLMKKFLPTATVWSKVLRKGDDLRLVEPTVCLLQNMNFGWNYWNLAILPRTGRKA